MIDFRAICLVLFPETELWETPWEWDTLHQWVPPWEKQAQCQRLVLICGGGRCFNMAFNVGSVRVFYIRRSRITIEFRRFLMMWTLANEWMRAYEVSGVGASRLSMERDFLSGADNQRHPDSASVPEQKHERYTTQPSRFSHRRFQTQRVHDTFCKSCHK